MQARLAKSNSLQSFFRGFVLSRLRSSCSPLAQLKVGIYCEPFWKANSSNIESGRALMLTWIIISFALPHGIESCNPPWDLVVDCSVTFQGCLNVLELACLGHLERTCQALKHTPSKQKRRLHRMVVPLNHMSLLPPWPRWIRRGWNERART